MLPAVAYSSGGTPLPAGLAGSGRDLKFLVELEAAVELPELHFSSTPETQVAIAVKVEAETVSSDLG